MKFGQFKIQKIWDWMNKKEGWFAKEVHGRANLVAGEAFMDGCSHEEADKIYLRTLLKASWHVFWTTIVCDIFGHKWERWETGDRESGPCLHAHCTRCGHGQNSSGWYDVKDKG